MEYRLKDLVREVRIALDENMSSEALEGLDDVDALSLDEIIRSKIADAARLVILAAPTHLLGTGKIFGKSISWHGAAGQGSGHILLPPDFLRLVIFRMSDWSRAVFDAITPDNPIYAMQSSRYPGLRGNPSKPVVAIVNSSVGMVLEFYSCTGGKGVSIKQAAYLPKPRILGDVIELSEKLKEPTVYQAASMVAATIGESDKATVLSNISNSLLEK